MDIKGSLMLGGALDDSLDSAASNLDLVQLKQTAEENKALRMEREKERERMALQGEDYASASRTLSRKVKIERQNRDEDRFTLTVPQRFFFLLLAASFSLSFGRSSNDLIAHYSADFESAVSMARLVFTAGIVSAIGSGVACSAMRSGSSSGSKLIWGLRGLLGGPLVLAELRMKQQGKTV